MNKTETLFFELLQIAIGTRRSLSVMPSVEEWRQLFEIAKKQALTAVAFRGVTKLRESVAGGDDFGGGIGIDEMTYLKWLGLTAKVAQRNKEVNDACVDLVSQLTHDGLKCCLLKGSQTTGFSCQMQTVSQMILRLNAIVEREVTAMQVAVVDESAACKRDEVKAWITGMVIAERHDIVHQVSMDAVHGHVIQGAVLDLETLVVDSPTNRRSEPLTTIQVDIRRKTVEGIGTAKRLADIDGSASLSTYKLVGTPVAWMGWRKCSL